MLSLLGIVLVVAFLIWLVTSFTPAPPWVNKVALIITLTILVIMALGVTLVV